jgi:hypothetical protein
VLKAYERGQILLHTAGSRTSKRIRKGF